LLVGEEGRTCQWERQANSRGGERKTNMPAGETGRTCHLEIMSVAGACRTCLNEMWAVQYLSVGVDS
jgi:hypothetical protein